MRLPNLSMLNIVSAAVAAVSGQAFAHERARHAPFERLCAEHGGPSHHPEQADRLARLRFSQTFLEARLTALRAENPRLVAFYNSLDVRQQEKFDRFRARGTRLTP